MRKIYIRKQKKPRQRIAILELNLFVGLETLAENISHLHKYIVNNIFNYKISDVLMTTQSP